MNRVRSYCLMSAALIAALTLASVNAPAQTTPSQARPAFAQSARLEKLTREVVRAVIGKFGKGGLAEDKIAITIIDLNDRQRPAWASYRGQEQTYPASVVKLFYL